MEVLKTIHTRQSVRNYKSAPVSQELLDQILDAAICAPSGKNKKPWKFKIITDASNRARKDEHLWSSVDLIIVPRFSFKHLRSARTKSNRIPPSSPVSRMRFQYFFKPRKAWSGIKYLVDQFSHHGYNRRIDNSRHQGAKTNTVETGIANG